MGAPLTQAAHDRAELLLRSHPTRTVAMLTGHSLSTLRDMRRRGWKAAGHTCPRRPRPTDFAIQSRHMNDLELRTHYRAGNVVSRWRRELSQ